MAGTLQAGPSKEVPEAVTCHLLFFVLTTLPPSWLLLVTSSLSGLQQVLSPAPFLCEDALTPYLIRLYPSLPPTGHSLGMSPIRPELQCCSQL